VAASPLLVLRWFRMLVELAESDLIQRIDGGAEMAARQMQVEGGVL
jgi:hypothetical protein